MDLDVSGSGGLEEDINAEAGLAGFEVCRLDFARLPTPFCWLVMSPRMVLEVERGTALSGKPKYEQFSTAICSPSLEEDLALRIVDFAILRKGNCLTFL